MSKKDRRKGLDSIFEFKACSGVKRNCPNVILNAEELLLKLKEIVEEEGLEKELKSGYKGPILPHFKFKVGIAGCPNGCSRPQIMDLSLLARVRPEVVDEECIGCQKCIEACKEEAIELQDEIAVVDYEKCLDCGDCIKACPVDAIEKVKEGWSFGIGGKLGRHPQFATKLVDLMGAEEVIDKFVRLIKFYQEERKGREKLAVVLNRLGEVKVRQELDI
ncbi:MULTISPECIES: 4Fe-4S dicluster domain-containing protein [unclassified Candidatus Frackibacter]|uniref:4Fe-4S dicluster domain-containing protein n=1 Tax=unclassified Candidatus Frackibacter TaxID=2648818 RepID=UPI0007978F5B|nr:MULTISPECIES: 4Fe-4S dicluster domain-containing protein [unclassified Candidatus Frackibacter]KXS41949.1 MAG: dissimilatory sulfite reductase (desulfoviridin), alpha/beta subunit [Candidatus Frackibacter sp. T328-2]SDC02196.1 4Fe-4S dicluster domain-containing protein [Candidatus Frackibacter sp. WG11]SEM33366.1 4Fe-4S dicluster domain-containing protein [Candidatus Frackibacter sp. WG12]SFL38403.1 4Fe-4S dicluster domain-containing protein [Candidatus Frackibacter sp. WG13]